MYKANRSFVAALFFMLATLGMATDASAAQIFGTAATGTVGLATSGAARTDAYTVTCAAGTSYLSASVKDMAPVKSPLVSIQVTKGGASSALSTDAVDGNFKYSPTVKLVKGSGGYTMKVNKSASSVKGVELYLVRFYCQNAKGVRTKTQAQLTQNQ